jgi:Recombinase zinc beta ribbon domain
MMANNVRPGERSGAARRGLALLAGLLRCQRCGRKLMVTYTGNGPYVLRYQCHRGRLDNGDPVCISFAGLVLDEAMGKEVLRVVQPAAVEAAVLASQQEALEQDEVLGALQRECEAAQYAAHRAAKQYDVADPENRLVADELERRWNQALQKVQELEWRIQHQKQRRKVASAKPEEFAGLAGDLEAVWNRPDSDARLKKLIVRALLTEVMVDVEPEGGEIIVVLHWKGGVHTELRLPRRRRGQNRAQTPKEIVEAVKVLTRVCSDDAIAGILTRNGLLTGRGNRWTRERVVSLRSYHSIPCYSQEQRQVEGWLTLTEAAAQLGISGVTLRLAIERGEIQAEHPLEGPWVLHRGALGTAAAAQLIERSRRHKRPPALASQDQAFLDLSVT